MDEIIITLDIVCFPLNIVVTKMMKVYIISGKTSYLRFEYFFAKSPTMLSSMTRSPSSSSNSEDLRKRNCQQLIITIFNQDHPPHLYYQHHRHHYPHPQEH